MDAKVFTRRKRPKEGGALEGSIPTPAHGTEPPLPEDIEERRVRSKLAEPSTAAARPAPGRSSRRDPHGHPPPPAPPPPRQLYLDLGQASYGPTRCRGCGMEYCKGEVSDEALHRTYHKANAGKEGAREATALMLDAAALGQATVLTLFPDGRRIVEFPSPPPPRAWAAVQAVAATAEEDLGLTPGSVLGGGGLGSGDTAVVGAAGIRSLLYLERDNKVRGALFAEPGSKGHDSIRVRCVWVANGSGGATGGQKGARTTTPAPNVTDDHDASGHASGPGGASVPASLVHAARKNLSTGVLVPEARVEYDGRGCRLVVRREQAQADGG